MNSNCTLFTGKLLSNKRESNEEIIVKRDNEIEIVFFEEDTLDDFEVSLNKVCGNSSFFFGLRKQIAASILSFISVLIIMFALLSSSLYEDVFKKLLFQTPLQWNVGDSISIVFVLVLFFGLLMMPSILAGESSQLKDILQTWFNKDARRVKRIRLALKELDKKYEIKIYNIDFLKQNHWMWKLVVPSLIKHFVSIDFYIRNDQKRVIEKRLKSLEVLNIKIENKRYLKNNSNVELLLSTKEKALFSLLHLSSTTVINSNNNVSKKFVSLELFEYCGRSFFLDKSNEKEADSLISGFQNFINRCSDDFFLLAQEKSAQMYFTNIVKQKVLDDEKRRLSYFLRNHIEQCLEYFDNPISLLILYYYVKDIILDEKRTIAILERLIFSIKKKQQYALIDIYWFDIAGKMFDSKEIENFTLTNKSIYRKLSISSLNDLKFLFERNGHFDQALFLCEYLYEINPSKYAIDKCSLYERMGNFDKAYDSLPKDFLAKSSLKPNDIEVKYLQRKSWIIVSQRKEEKKKEGLDSLAKLREILFSHIKDNEPLWLWHYYNIKANYYEWNKDYDKAITNYKKCLLIPTLGAFEYGGTFINMSIAYRFKYLKNSLENTYSINQSILLGDIAVSLKNSVGDRDEIPVVLHNQALNILYKLVDFEDKELIQKAINLTNTGIEILDSTNSIKRLGIILCENIIAKSLLGLNVDSLRKRLEEHWKLMDTYEKEQISLVFEKFVQKGICKPLI